ncbi:MAG: hypothetical protein MUC71_05615 [Steroidobacteraceae bacterium]|nr:hypothetical protein [Steroidobacteraceae bacterium]
MTSRAAQLEARRRLLVAESKVQRESLRLEATHIGDTLQRVDRSVMAVRRLARNPWVIGAGVVALFLLRRYPLANWALRGIALTGTARRAMGTLNQLAGSAPARGGPGR